MLHMKRWTHVAHVAHQEMHIKRHQEMHKDLRIRRQPCNAHLTFFQTPSHAYFAAVSSTLSTRASSCRLAFLLVIKIIAIRLCLQEYFADCDDGIEL